jgi:PAP2 superfamily
MLYSPVRTDDRVAADRHDLGREPESAARGRAVTRAIRRWWRSRFGAELAWEIALIVGLLVLYRLGRQLARDASSAAFDHARDVLALETRLHMASEADLQGAVLRHPWLVDSFNQWYARVHFPTTIVFLVVLWWRAPDRYRPVRRLFTAVTALGLVLHIAYPLAPPRMLPGFVDTIARFGPTIYDRPGVASVANQYAAMPSLHFGWAALVAYGIIRGGTKPWRWIAIAYPVITLLAIVATANHYWLDAAVAGALILVAAPFCIRPTAPANAGPLELLPVPVIETPTGGPRPAWPVTSPRQ